MFGEGSLSQDEIEALLSGTDKFESITGFDSIRTSDVDEGILSETDRANLTELVKQILESNRNIYRAQIAKEVSISALTIDTFEIPKLSSEVVGEFVDVKFIISGNITGEVHFIYPVQTVLSITNPAVGDENNTILSDLIMSTFQDITSVVISSFVSTLSEKIGKTLAASAPSFQKLPNVSALTVQNIPHVMVSFNISISGKQSKVYWLMPQSMVKQILISYASRKFPEANKAVSQKGLKEQEGKLVVKPAEFEPLQEIPPEAEGSLALILDVPVQVTVELGRTKMLVKEILQLGEGSVVELDKLAGEPVDVLVNGRLIAKGEVVVIEENFGVRITEIVNHVDRMFKYADRD
ncbi:MAG: flagellar motor switch protein FliN [Brevinematia bacterium]